MRVKTIIVAAIVSCMASLCAIADVVDDKAQFDAELAFEVTQASSEAFGFDTPDPTMASTASIAFERIQAESPAFMATLKNRKPLTLAQVDVLNVNLPSEVGWQF